MEFLMFMRGAAHSTCGLPIPAGGIHPRSAGRPLLTRPPYPLHNSRQVLLNLPSTKPDHAVSAILEPPRPRRIVGWLIFRRVAVAVDLDNKASFRAIEIEDEPVDRMLAAELEPELAAPDRLP